MSRGLNGSALNGGSNAESRRCSTDLVLWWHSGIIAAHSAASAELCSRKEKGSV